MLLPTCMEQNTHRYAYIRSAQQKALWLSGPQASLPFQKMVREFVMSQMKWNHSIGFWSIYLIFCLYPLHYVNVTEMLPASLFPD